MPLIERIQQIYSTELAVPLEEVGPDLKYGSTPDWDSNSHMILVVAVEEAFDVAFDSDEIVTLVTFDDIRNALIAKGVEDS